MADEKIGKAKAESELTSTQNYLIPFLMKIALEPSIDTLDHRPFALTMLCDFAYASAATRIELWRHDGIDFYTSLFRDPHWQGLALGAIANWYVL